MVMDTEEQPPTVTTAADDQVVVTRSGSVATLTLNRPERRNALSLELMNTVTRTLATLGASPDVGAIVIAAAGPAFSAGHDLGEMVDRDAEFYAHLFDVCTDMMNQIHAVPQPVIARVHGMATAAGCQLVAACDLVVASESARFATPGVRIGLFCSTPMVPISRAVGRKRALQMLLTGEPIDAETACDWGLVNIVTPDDGLDAAVADLTDRITRFSRATIGIGKEAFYRQMDVGENDAYAYTKDVMAANAGIADAEDGIGAFLDKRTPVWNHES